VKNRIELYGKQKEEIDKLTRTMQQEEKEIKRLTQMLKMTHKQDLGVQTESIDED
jgi:DNA anti-recombination protein RmuC